MDHRKSIVEHIRQIEIQEKSGSLYLACAQAESGDLSEAKEILRFYFEKGLVSAMSSSSPDRRCGQCFLKEGLLDPPELYRLLKAKDHVPLGERIVELGLADPVQVKLLLHSQSVQIFRHALEADFRVESFEATPVHFGIPLALDLDTLLLELARTSNRNGLDLEPNRKIRLLAERDFSTLPWRPEEIAALDELRESKTFDELLEATGLLEDQLRTVLQTFQQLAIIESVEQQNEGETVALATRPRLPLELLVPETKSTLMSEQIETARNEHSFTSEQFASLKVRLKGPSGNFESQLIAVTSPHMEDGKSLVCANLAFSFARDPGRRTILVDFDFRRPSVDRYLGIPLEPGAIGYLANSVMKPYCFMRRVGELYVMTAGGTADNPVELLSLKKTRALIDYLKSEFDVVLLDTPPLNPISDTRIISNLVDGLVFVIRRGKTPFSMIQKAMSAVDRKKIRGVVFNEVKPLLFHTYYNYSYYGYGKDSAYPYKSGGRKHRLRKH